MIEQPLMHDDILDHAKLQKMIGTPICLDESICSLQDARQAIEIGACKYINIKYGRVGGITPSLAIHDLCGEKNIGCWLGGMGESSLGTNVVANLATLPYVNYPSDISPAEKFYVENLGTPVLLTEQYGTYTLRDNPGLDVVANEEVLAKYKQALFFPDFLCRSPGGKYHGHAADHHRWYRFLNMAGHPAERHPHPAVPDAEQGDPCHHRYLADRTGSIFLLF